MPPNLATGEREQLSPRVPTRSSRASPSDNAIDDEECDPREGIVKMSERMEKREKEKAAAGSIEQILGFPMVPFAQPLGILDLDSCIALENEAFEKHHRCTPEKFKYRLTKCPEISMGLFCRVPADKVKDLDLATVPSARIVETGRADVMVLLAHIVSTRSRNEVVTDDDMTLPPDWETSQSTKVGHQNDGDTICLHSLAVLPKVHGCGIGKMLLKAYLQRTRDAAMADRVALICQDYLTEFYERFGFKNLGPSKAQFGGGGWYNMAIRFQATQTPI